MIILEFKGPIDLQKTFECGQCFLWNSYDSGKTYYGVLNQQPMKIYAISENSIGIDTIKETPELIEKLKKFFRIQDDYEDILMKVSIDPLMKEVVEYGKGLRLLQQEPFECIISYLLSQMANIPKIKLNLRLLCEKFGKKVKFDGKEFYLFPERCDLLSATVECFNELKFGYRSEYIYRLVQEFPEFLECVDEEIEDYSKFNKDLLTIHGIGQKVADCIQLFAYGDTSSFPVDVWMQRFMEKYYNEGKPAKPTEMKALGEKMFGKYSGYAQELIFYYARTHDLGIEKGKPKPKRNQENMTLIKK